MDAAGRSVPTPMAMCAARASASCCSSKLSAAQRDGDRIHALIRGTSVNHGGRANSLTAPNPRAQAELIKAAYRDAGVDTHTVGCIEAHGTGTSLGDPVEIQGLKLAFAELRL